MSIVSKFSISLERWLEMLEQHYRRFEKLHPPEVLREIVHARVIDRSPSEWEFACGRWIEGEEFEAWNKKGLQTVRSRPLAERTEVMLACLRILVHLEEEFNDPLSEINKIYDDFVIKHPGDSVSGIRKGHTDAFDEICLICQVMAKAIIRPKLPLPQADIEELIHITLRAIEFHHRNILAGENYPFSAVMQQLNKQSMEILLKVKPSLLALRENLSKLPVDSSDSNRHRQKLKTALESILLKLN